MKDNVPALYPNLVVGERVTDYADEKTSDLPAVLAGYHAAVLLRPDSFYTISTFQAKTLGFLARSVGAKRVLEIGVFVGFSAMVWADAVGPDGRVTGLEYSEKYADEARQALKANGFSNVDIVTGSAHETLPNIDVTEPYDIIFIDADKTGYPGYLKTILDRSPPGDGPRLLRKGGLIVADNVLRRALVVDSGPDNPRAREEDAESDEFRRIVACLEAFNAGMKASPRVEALLLPLFDGLGMGRLVD